jgi:phosphatidylglycerol lysyltransferase
VSPDGSGVAGQPPSPASPASPAEPRGVALTRARELVLRHGWNATAYQILNPGIALWFSSAGDGVVGYARASGVRVVAGAPVCDVDRLAGVAAEFEREAARAGDRTCYFGAGARLETLYGTDPANAFVVLGAQPVWDPSGWPEIVARHASLRAQLNRARNKGVVVTEWPAARASAHPALRRCLAEWLVTRGLPPLHFLVEPETLDNLDDRRLFVAERAGAVVGFLVASPVPARQGWLAEQIVRCNRAPNGTNELMVDAAMRALAGAGSGYVTLGLSPLSTRAPQPSDAAVARLQHPLWLTLLLRWVRAHGRRFYNFEGLDAFKGKLRPHAWEPIFAISRDTRFSPRTLYAIAWAFSGGSPVALVARALGRAVVQEVRGLVP